jgi:phosphatidylserine/phosphatidylglycerophosphate/cardiolipin synthase-like enzyme
MAKFLNTADINSHIDGIIQNARKKIVLVSPFLQLSEDWISSLRQAAEREVKIIVIFGKKKSQPAAKEVLATISGLTLYYMKNMHAKCYFNEQQMVIASMNLYAYSAKNNREMGIMLNRITDTQAFNEAILETKAFITAAQQEFLLAPASEKGVKMMPAKHKGKCIRCTTYITYDPGHPLCGDCFAKTVGLMSPHYMAKYCHECGSASDTSMWYPICAACTRRQQNKNNAIQIAL